MTKKGTVKEVEEAKWRYRKDDLIEWLELVVHDKEGREVLCCLELRPHYCDRGHLTLKIDSRGLKIDWADSFPRYFFDFEEADLHTRRFLNWRIHKQRECIHWLCPPGQYNVIFDEDVK